MGLPSVVLARLGNWGPAASWEKLSLMADGLLTGSH